MRIYDRDTLSLMSEYELEKVFRICKSKIKSANFSGKSKTDRKSIRKSISSLEREYCYIKRELELRECRRIAHESYLASLQQKVISA